MTVVFNHHCKSIGYCNRGMRSWFKREGLDWGDFLKHGIDAEVLRKFENAMVDRAIAYAEKEAGK